jgi:membrane-associated phospholipid phosphatase
MWFLLENIPIFLFFLSIYLLITISQENLTLLLFYIVGFITNELLTRVLKPWIRDPRPGPVSRPLAPTDKYGMPSGHSQLAAFSLVFMALVLQEKHYGYGWIIILLFLFLTLVSMVQRVVIKAHSIAQVIIGGLLGGGIGYLFYDLSKKIYKKKIILPSWL